MLRDHKLFCNEARLIDGGHRDCKLLWDVLVIKVIKCDKFNSVRMIFQSILDLICFSYSGIN